MPRRLVVTVPDLECIGCRTKAPATPRYIARAEPHELRADLQPPVGWCVLWAERMPDGAREARKFAICPPCYERGQPTLGLVVDALYEARET